MYIICVIHTEDASYSGVEAANKDTRTCRPNN